MTYVTYEPELLPRKGETWRDLRNGTLYRFVANFRHDPKTCGPFDYVIMQEHSNYRNEMEIIEVEAFPHLFTFEWGPLIECRFCGFPSNAPMRCEASMPEPKIANVLC